jgi:hypothetical protein
MIPIAKPFLDEREADAVRRVILSGWITQGPELAAFTELCISYESGRDHFWDRSADVGRREAKSKSPTDEEAAVLQLRAVQ